MNAAPDIPNRLQGLAFYLSYSGNYLFLPAPNSAETE